MGGTDINPQPQHSLNGFYLGDKIKFKSAGKEYTGEVIETEHLSAWIKVTVHGTSATVVVNDVAVSRIDNGKE